MYICNELVKVGEACGELTICESASVYEATWECSCGAKQEAPVRGPSIASAAENAKASYREHCGAVHRD
jgi:hypothetical protein